MQPSYTLGMADPRDELRDIGTLTRDLPARKWRAIDQARAQNVTWREIAELLGMTQHGVIKAWRNPPENA